MTDRRLSVSVNALMGKCQSCQYSIGTAAKFGPPLLCQLDNAATKPHYQCGRYTYAPGSLA